MPILRQLLSCLALLATAASAADNPYIDTTYGVDGVVTLRNFNSIFPALLLADGSLLALGATPDPAVYEGAATVLKLTRRGEIDTTFGVLGATSLKTFNEPTGTFPVFSLGRIFEDGRGGFIVTANRDQTLAREESKLVMFRLTAQGKLDASFGTAGSIAIHAESVMPITGLGTWDEPLSYLPARDGKAYVLALRHSSDNFGYPRPTYRGFVARLAHDGSLDSTFGNGGILVLPFTVESGRLDAEGVLVVTGFQADLQSISIRVAPDGKIMSSVLSAAPQLGGYPYPQRDGSWIVSPTGLPYYGAGPLKMFRADGLPEMLFGNNGMTIDAENQILVAYAWKTMDGGIVATGQSTRYEKPFRLCLWRASGRSEWCGDLPGWKRDDTSAWLAPDGSLYISSWSNPPSPPARIARLVITPGNVEFFNQQSGHYFVTYDSGIEERLIAQGGAGPGWSRTEYGFKTGGTTPVCRFYGTPGIGSNSHFFTINAEECELVKKDPGWTFEGYGFYATPAVDGQCEMPLVPVSRLYNNRAAQRDSNHRHITDPSLLPAMRNAGWSYEGVAFCARP